MYLMISLVFVFIFSIVLSKSISKYALNYYLGTILVGVLLLINPIINQRYIGLAFLILVMYIGVMNEKKEYISRLKTVRGSLAIMAVELIAFHAIKHIIQLNISLYGLIAFLFLFPLMISSFKAIKNTLSQPIWNKLHKLAYLGYGFVYLHLMIEADFLDQLIYSSLFFIYFVLRIIKLVKNKRNQSFILKNKNNT